MKKTFVKVALLCALALVTPISFVSCKDYDKDIERIDKADSELTNQLTTLQAALNATKGEVDAAKASTAEAIAAAKAAKETGDAAAAAAASAKAEAELAKQAAATAKAEAIDAAVKEAQRLMQNAATKDDLASLASKIEGIEKGLSSKLASVQNEIDEIKKFGEAIDIQKRALDEFKVLVNSKLQGIDSKLTEINGKIDGLQSQLNDFKSTMASKADLKAEVEKLSAEISTKITTNINTVISSLTKRLTSISLVPEYYCEGIPAIRFESAKYSPMKLNDKYELVATGETAKVLTNGSTTANFRLNPSTVFSGDIGTPFFVCDEAEAISRSTKESPVKFGGAAIFDNGIFKVTVTKSIDGSLNNLGDNKFHIAALCVPIAEKNLTETEKANGGASIYSEYIRIVETETTPQIAELGNEKANRFFDHKTVFGSAIGEKISYEIPYNSAVNIIEKYISGCMVKGTNFDRAISKKDLSAFGFTFELEVASPSYILGANNTDQQKYLGFNKNGEIWAQSPDGKTKFSPGAIDKEPIITIKLKHGDNLVDQKFIKLKIVKAPVQIINLEIIKDFGKVDLFKIASEYNFTSDDMANLVYSHKEVSLSKEVFNQRYPKTSFSYESADGTLINLDDPNIAQGANLLQWKLLPSDVGTIDLGKLYKELFITAVFKDPNETFNTIKFTFKITVTMTLGKMNDETGESNWIIPGQVMRVLPNKYVPGTTCEYNTNLWHYFVNNGKAPVIVPTDAEGWDVQFSNSGQISGYTGNNYKLTNGGSTVVELVWNSGHNQWVGPSTSTMITLANNVAGKALLNSKDATSNFKRVAISFKGSNNRYNRYEIINGGACQLQFVTPLYFDVTENVGSFTDKGTTPSTIDNSTVFTIKDNYDNTVSQSDSDKPGQNPSPSALYTYYGVTGVKWGSVENARAAMKDVGGSLVIDPSITYETSQVTAKMLNLALTQNGNKLTFTNNGTPTEKAYKLYIPVTITHKWGEETRIITVTVNPGIKK